jgi:hypothetical protein
MAVRKPGHGDQRETLMSIRGLCEVVRDVLLSRSPTATASSDAVRAWSNVRPMRCRSRTVAAAESNQRLSAASTSIFWASEAWIPEAATIRANPWRAEVATFPETAEEVAARISRW